MFIFFTVDRQGFEAAVNRQGFEAAVKQRVLIR